MSGTYWTQPELGAALEARDYKKMKTLIAAGADFDTCLLKHDKWPTLHNALYYANDKKDLALVKFIVKNNCTIAHHVGPMSGRNLFYPDYAPEIYKFMCQTAYKKILKNEIEIYQDMREGLMTYFEIDKTNFLGKEFSKAKDTQTAGRLLKAILQERNKVQKEVSL